ncbi:MAG: uroporphyrinogen-III C-methyltransferase [Pseudomonadota bacterium]
MRPDFKDPIARSGAGLSGSLTGSVSLVGAGPGDPDLLTVKALKAIEAADVIFHDRLVSDEILAMAPAGTALVPVGKSKGNHSVPQTQIHTLMIEAASAGLNVVRLKGGDPFIFGRGGEERDAVQAAGIPATVIPGISSALGCAASTGIPLTHRDHAQSVTFVTGHAQSAASAGQSEAGERVPDLDWTALARTNQTVVVFMGIGTAATIADRLTAAGRSADTPVAVIENGTRANEVTVRGTLGNLADIIKAAGIKGPALLVIGEVVTAQGKVSTSATPEPVANAVAAAERANVLASSVLA